MATLRGSSRVALSQDRHGFAMLGVRSSAPSRAHPMNQAPIDLYSWATPNGHKVHVMLEECELPYVVHAIDIGKGQQFDSDFLAISPNNKIPAISDPVGPDGAPITIFESGAILWYLAEKSGKLLPKDLRQRQVVLQWLMFQMGGVGPMLGQAHHFRLYAPEKIAYAVDRYTNEARRLYGVIDRRLEASPFIAGKDYSIADIALFPWISSWQKQGIVLEDFPTLRRWLDAIGGRPAVQRGMQVLAAQRTPFRTDAERENLFGQTQYSKR